MRSRVQLGAQSVNFTFGCRPRQLGFLDRKPRALSGGQRQRVAMGRAIVRQPAAYLMDEPLSNLDAKLRVHMRAEIASLQHGLGVTTIYVTHDQVEAMTMGHRVAVMRKGELQQVAPPQELYDRPVNLFVGGFIGSPAMNLFESSIERRNGGLYARVGALVLALYLIPVSLVFHDFWNVAGPERAGQMADFLKNVALAGGLLLIVAHGAGRHSLDERLYGHRS